MNEHGSLFGLVDDVLMKTSIKVLNKGIVSKLLGNEVTWSEKTVFCGFCLSSWEKA